MRLKKFRLIFLLVFLMTGLSITGWAISTHYDQTLKSVAIQEELTNITQSEKVKSGEFRNNSPILFLISTGLIGLIGIRRQRKIPENFKPNNTINQ